jgi:hypothetical protein
MNGLGMERVYARRGIIQNCGLHKGLWTRWMEMWTWEIPLVGSPKRVRKRVKYIVA